MKNIILGILVILQSSILFSQVGIGTTLPRATLEISNSDNGGLLIPQYALTGNNDATTVVNPQAPGALIDGTLVYNTTAITGGNALAKGFVYWDSNTSTWNEVGAPAIGGGTQVMLRRFTANSIGGVNTVFNFPSESFNNITSSSFSGTSITLPTGVYIVESNLRLNSNRTIDWRTRLDGTQVPGSVSGSANPTTFNTNASTVQAVAVFEITNATGVIDFQVSGTSNNNNINTIPGQCYVLIKKLN